MEKVMDLMELTASNKGFQAPSVEYIQRLLFQSSNISRLYIAEAEGEVLAAAVCVFWGGKAYFMYGCSRPTGSKYHANELLQWQMHSDAIAFGCRYFDFRGVEGYSEPQQAKFGLHRYKQGFGGQFQAYVGQADLVFRPMAYRLYQWKCRRFQGKKGAAAD